MSKALVITFLIHFLTNTGLAAIFQQDHAVPKIQFENAQSVPVNKLCVDGKHVRPIHSDLVRVGAKSRPIREVIEYDLGHHRKFTLIRKVKIKNHLIRRYARRDGVQQLISQGLYDIPKCQFSIIEHNPALSQKREPGPQQMLIFSALFQKGITLAQTEGYPFRPYYYDYSHFENPSFGPIRHQNSTTISTLKTPQCNDGLVELSPEFMRYLKGPEGHRNYRDVVDLMDTDPEYTEKYFNQIWNNHLQDKDLIIIGGEGSGNGRVGFGLSFAGGEGSGNGRRLEHTITDPLSVNPDGEVQVKIYMEPSQFYSLDYHPGLIERLFGQEIKYKKYLIDGELIPENIVGVECK